MSILNLRHCFVTDDLPFTSLSKILLILFTVGMELMYKEDVK